jgi:hypothetical protein
MGRQKLLVLKWRNIKIWRLVYSLVVKSVLAGSLRYSRLSEWLLQGRGGDEVAEVVVLAAVVVASFECLISYRNSGMMGTETNENNHRHRVR